MPTSATIVAFEVMISRNL